MAWLRLILFFHDALFEKRALGTQHRIPISIRPAPPNERALQLSSRAGVQGVEKRLSLMFLASIHYVEDLSTISELCIMLWRLEAMCI